MKPAPPVTIRFRFASVDGTRVMHAENAPD
jgi:hypothetical protein